MSSEPRPGIYEDVPFEEYAAWPYLNSSVIAEGLRSMIHLRTALTQPPAATDAMRLGIFLHAGRLEPVAVLGRYVVMPPLEDQVRRPDGRPYDNPKATKAYKQLVAQFRETNADKQIVPQDWYDTLVGMMKALAASPRTADCLEGEGPVEVSIVWDDPDTGVRCKGRIDKWQPAKRNITEFTTTRDAGDFARAIYKYGYHRQGAMYADGIEVLTGLRHHLYLVTAEKVPPYGVRSAPLDQQAMTLGRRQYKHVLARYANCRDSGLWPGYDDPPAWALPSWAVQDAGQLCSPYFG